MLSREDLIISHGCSQQPASPLGISGPLINKEESLEEEAVITKLAFPSGMTYSWRERVNSFQLRRRLRTKQCLALCWLCRAAPTGASSPRNKERELLTQKS